MSDPLRASVVGFGKMGMLHSSILGATPGVALASIVEPQPLLRAFGPKGVGVPFRKSLAQALRRDRPDLVYITTPTGSHPALAAQALAAGCAVFVEKPLGPTLAACEAVARLAANRPAMVGYCKRFAPTFAHAHRLLAAGAIGEVRSFHGTALVAQVFQGGTGWRYDRAAGGGALAVIGCHLVDLLRWFFGEPTAADGQGTAIHSAAVDDEFQGSLQFGTGLAGTFEVSWSRLGHRVLDTSLAVTGTQGTLTVTDDLVRIEGPRPALHHKQALAATVPLDLGAPEYGLETQAFVAAVRAGQDPPIPVADAYRTQALIDRLQASRPLARRAA
ncbi:MAG: Gfo/Idh/MocA family oxidoreductase [Halobacteriales archaeon]|nr:Gfo/Idh/MocA family oxidoreductase [Halobacteriales archaeon]